jgi:cytochrome bd ubiquinol oxidase subunit II
VALLSAVAAAARSREGWAFAFTAVTIVAAVATLFGDLWPNVLPSSTAAAYSLTVTNASSAHYTLMVMTWVALTVTNASSAHYTLMVMPWVALIFTLVMLAYQGWTYWVFRKRLSNSDIGLVDAIGTAAPPPRFAAGQP